MPPSYEVVKGDIHGGINGKGKKSTWLVLKSNLLQEEKAEPRPGGP